MPDGYPTKKAALEFVAAYEGKFGPRAHFASLAWDALKIMEAAVPVAGPSACWSGHRSRAGKVTADRHPLTTVQ
jgi:hypothetical protein